MNKPESPDARSARRKAVYEQLRGVSDADALHDLIVRKGAEVLDQPIPYLVAAARNQRVTNWRRAGGHRELPLAEELDTQPVSFWDPAERVANDDELRRLLDSLAAMDDRDILVLWRHVQGASDQQILEEWNTLGFEPRDIDTSAIRKRRSRARLKLRQGVARP